MTTFYLLDDSAISTDPSGLLCEQLAKRLQPVEYRPNIFAELCVLDLFLAICRIRDSYYGERLILKGGHSVRTYVPLEAHRFSYDLDFNIDRKMGCSFGEVDELKQDLNEFAQDRGTKIRGTVARNDQRFYWIVFNYRHMVNKTYGIIIPEAPKIEICKDCKTIGDPAQNQMVTMIDPKLLGIDLPNIKQLDVNEQLSNKLYVIGVPQRRRRHFDIYDAYRITQFNSSILDWSVVRESFLAHLRKKEKPSALIERAKHLINKTLEDNNTIRRIEATTFGTFDFKEAAEAVSDIYSKI
jgi:hypothetical protein